MIRKTLLTISILISGIQLKAMPLPADTLLLNLQQAEQIFLDKNLELLAQHYNIQEAEAHIRQARVWENPNISVSDFNLRPPHPDRMFDELPGRPQQYVIGIEQLITTAGKRSNLVRMERINARIAGYAYQDAIRTLKYELRRAFFELEKTQRAVELLEQEVEVFGQLVNTFRQQHQQGNISTLELARLTAFLYELRAELHDTRSGAREAQQELKLLLHLSPETVIVPVSPEFTPRTEQLATLTLGEIIEQAVNNRQDLLITRSETEMGERNLAFQRAMAVPDLGIGAAYDRWGGISEGFIGVGISMDIPIFNRNRGNIQAARAAIDRNRHMQQAHEHQVQNEAFDALANLFEINELMEGMEPGFQQEYQNLYEQMRTNFTQRNISLIEFLDFMDSFKAQHLNNLYLQFKYRMAIEELNLATGTDIIRN